MIRQKIRRLPGWRNSFLLCKICLLFNLKSMKIKEIAFSVYAVTDIKKSRKFYEGVLGLVPNSDFPVSDESYWVEYNIGSGTLGIGQSEQWKPSEDGASVALEVEDFDQAIKELKDANVKFFVPPSEFPTCHMAVIQDPDNNKICIH